VIWNQRKAMPQRDPDPRMTDAEIEDAAKLNDARGGWFTARAIRQLQADVKKRDREIETLREAYTTLNFNHRAAKADHASLVVKLTAENAANERLVASMSEDYRDTIEGLRKDVAERDALIDESRRTVTAALADVNACADTIADLRAQIARLELAATAWRDA
jgi:SMC interacting uncharacterized protein involved in chromosome segregation